jgi:hypothetical protein
MVTDESAGGTNSIFLISDGVDMCGSLCFFWHPIVMQMPIRKQTGTFIRIAHSFRSGNLTICF